LLPIIGKLEFSSIGFLRLAIAVAEAKRLQICSPNDTTGAAPKYDTLLAVNAFSL